MSHGQSWVRRFVWLLAACAWAESQADLAVIHQMRVHAAGVKHARVFHRSPVDGDLDAIFALGGPSRFMGTGSRGPWEREIKLGIFLQQRSRPGLVYKIVIADAPSFDGWTARVERVTSTEAVIACAPEKGNPDTIHKFRYDIRAKALLGQSTYDAVPMGDVLTDGGRTVLVGWNLEQQIAIEYLAGADPPFRVLSRREAASWIRRIPAAKTRSSFIGAATRPVFQPVRFGPDQRFSLRLRGVNDGLGLPGLLVIREQSGKSGKWFTLPQSTYDEFSAARPIRVQGGYVRGQTTIAEEIGPWQVVDGTLWFGKTFYDGEGMNGVGGFGFFDTGSRRFVIHSPAEIRDSSVSAMLAETHGIWLGLANRGEWANSGNGVLQVSYSGEALGRIGLSEPVGGIARVDGGLLMATSFGAALYDGQCVRRFFVDQTEGGRLRVVEADPGENEEAQ
ncbi:MAG: hypothetical protein C0504_14760 [Candidatus Solibacter sp.]|nr:hypothetical protein [Candidatus Solibacter sp.]